MARISILCIIAMGALLHSFPQTLTHSHPNHIPSFQRWIMHASKNYWMENPNFDSLLCRICWAYDWKAFTDEPECRHFMSTQISQWNWLNSFCFPLQKETYLHSLLTCRQLQGMRADCLLEIALKFSNRNKVGEFWSEEWRGCLRFSACGHQKLVVKLAYDPSLLCCFFSFLYSALYCCYLAWLMWWHIKLSICSAVKQRYTTVFVYFSYAEENLLSWIGGNIVLLIFLLQLQVSFWSEFCLWIHWKSSNVVGVWESKHRWGELQIVHRIPQRTLVGGCDTFQLLPRISRMFP